MSNQLSFGGESHPDPETVAHIIARLHEHADEYLGEHHTVEIRTFDDGTISAQCFETLEIMPGVGTVQPGAMRQEVRYVEQEDKMQYRQYLERAGKIVEVNEKQTVEKHVLVGESDE